MVMRRYMILILVAIISTTACTSNNSDNDHDSTTQSPQIKSITAKRYAKSCIDYTPWYDYGYNSEWQQYSEVTLDDYRVIVYNDLGIISSEVKYDADGMEIGYRKYNNDGLLYEEEHLYQIHDTYYKGKYLYEYNDNGKKVKTLMEYENGEYWEKELYIYDSEGNLTDTFCEDYDIGYKYHNKLDSQGRSIYEVMYLNDSWEYWNDSDVSFEVIYFNNHNSQDNIPSHMSLEWWNKDSYGSPILKFEGTNVTNCIEPETTTTYEHDMYGNVIAKKTIDVDTGEIIEVIEYDIEYAK